MPVFQEGLWEQDMSLFLIRSMTPCIPRCSTIQSSINSSTPLYLQSPVDSLNPTTVLWFISIASNNPASRDSGSDPYSIGPADHGYKPAVVCRARSSLVG